MTVKTKEIREIDPARLARSKLPRAERQAMLRSFVVEHERYSKATEVIARFHRPVTGGTHDYGKFLALIGDASAGKTFLLKRYAARFEPRDTAEGIVRPVVMVDTPVVGGLRAFAENIAEAIGFQFSQRINTPGLMNALIHILPKVGCELLIVDEFQEVADLRRPQGLKNVRGFLRRIVDQCGVNVVFAGLPESYDLIVKDPQIVGRGNLPSHFVPQYDWNSKSDRLGFRALCHKIDDQLPFVFPSGLSDEDLANRLVEVSKGLIGRLKGFIFSAGCLAIEDGSTSISRDHLAKVCVVAAPKDAASDPFTN